MIMVVRGAGMNSFYITLCHVQLHTVPAGVSGVGRGIRSTVYYGTSYFFFHALQ